MSYKFFTSGWTLLGFCNFFLFQWFFFRIYCRVVGDGDVVEGYGIWFPVRPLAHWNFDCFDKKETK